MAFTGYMVNGICAESSDAALLALGVGFPKYLGSTPPVMCNLSAQSFTAPNTFSQTITCHELNSSRQDIFVHPISLPACDPALDPNQFLQPTADQILFVFTWGMGAVVFLFFLGFVIAAAVKVIGKA